MDPQPLPLPNPRTRNPRFEPVEGLLAPSRKAKPAPLSGEGVLVIDERTAPEPARCDPVECPGERVVSLGPELEVHRDDVVLLDHAQRGTRQMSLQDLGGIDYMEVEQAAETDELTIVHNFGRVPTVNLYDASGRVLIGEVIPDETSVRIRFGLPLSFRAILK